MRKQKAFPRRYDFAAALRLETICSLTEEIDVLPCQPWSSTTNPELARSAGYAE